MNIGDNVLVDGKSPATIRYLGNVDNHPGSWVGVEWWYQQGKHDGTFQGKFYFKTEKPLSASFIRAERIQYGHSFSSAIYRQYVKSFDHEHIKDDIQYSLFGIDKLFSKSFNVNLSMISCSEPKVKLMTTMPSSYLH